MASKFQGGKHWQVTLMRHKTSKAVLYMEAGKEFVDLLFSFLTLPTSTVLKLIATLKEDKRKPGTALSNVLDSVHKLNKKHFLGASAVTQLLDSPICADLPLDVYRLVIRNAQTDQCFQAKVFYHCKCCTVLSEDYKDPATCEGCNGMTTKRNKCVVYHNLSNEGHGFVEGSGTYMITDDLRITKASTADVMLLFSQLNVQSLSDVETCKVRVTWKEALQLLEASIGATSGTVLNDVFPPEGS